MVSEKLKIICSVKLSRLEFVSLPIGDQLQPNLYKLSCVEQRITKLVYKIRITKFISHYFQFLKSFNFYKMCSLYAPWGFRHAFNLIEKSWITIGLMFAKIALINLEINICRSWTVVRLRHIYCFLRNHKEKIHKNSFCHQITVLAVQALCLEYEGWLHLA